MKESMRWIRFLCIVFFPIYSVSVFPAQKQALVIGNSNYQYQGKLNNPVNDAVDLAATLRSLGFNVKAYNDLGQSDMRRVIDQFGDGLRGSEVGLFFFAGHGMQVNGENYLFPVDANPKAENEVEYDCVNAGRVLSKMQTAGCGFNIVILDACRNNPFAESWARGGGSRGLAFISAPTGSIVAYATSPGKTAADGSGRNGLYTAYLLKYMKQSGLKIEDMFKRVRAEVQRASGSYQVPWELSSLTGDFYFAGAGGSVVPPPPVETEVLRPVIDNAGIEWVFVEGGSFDMGSNSGDSDEKPVHRVTVSSFYLSKTEVTFAQYDAFCEATGRAKPSDSGWGRGNRPVINVTWHDAAAYCKWAGGRLPTEAEWEYAARGGNQSRGYTYSGSNTLDDVGWYSGNSGSQTHAVGQKQANELGLYDMSGNVWEWCSDWYDSGYYSSSPSMNPQGPSSGSPRVLRGGGWGNSASDCRSAVRDRRDPGLSLYNNGFRCARTL